MIRSWFNRVTASTTSIYPKELSMTVTQTLDHQTIGPHVVPVAGSSLSTTSESSVMILFTVAIILLFGVGIVYCCWRIFKRYKIDSLIPCVFNVNGSHGNDADTVHGTTDTNLIRIDDARYCVPSTDFTVDTLSSDGYAEPNNMNETYRLDCDCAKCNIMNRRCNSDLGSLTLHPPLLADASSISKTSNFNSNTSSSTLGLDRMFTRSQYNGPRETASNNSKTATTTGSSNTFGSQSYGDSSLGIGRMFRSNGSGGRPEERCEHQ